MNGIRHLLFLAPSGELGGAERCLVDTIWSFRRAWPELEMHLIVGSDGPFVEEARKAGADVTVVTMPRATASLGDSGAGGSVGKLVRLILRMGLAVPSLAQYVMRLRRAVAARKPDAVHVLGLKMQLISLWAAPRPAPLVWNVQDYVGARRLISLLIRWNVRLFGRGRKLGAGCCANDVVRDFRTVVPEGSFRTIATVHNTVDLDTFTPEGPRIVLDAGADRIRIGLVATYARWKGQDVLIEAAGLLKGRPALPAWHAYVVGGPIYATAGSQWSAEELQSMIAARGLEKVVSLAPFQRDPAAVMRGLDIVVHASSKPEPFGRVIAEAQACGRAVVAVGTGGSGEVFEDGVTGLAIRANDAADLADVLERLLRNEALRQSLAAAGPNYVKARFDRRDLAAAWNDIYDTTTARQ